MVKKVILIEDRPQRQRNALGDKSIEQLQDTQGLYLPSENECRQLVKQLNTGDIPQSLEEYNLVIVHKISARNALRTFCKANQIDLIFFSGDFAQMVFENNGFQFLVLDVKDLYTKRLIEFIKKYTQGQTQNLLELVYGDDWQLDLIMRYRTLKSVLAQAQSLEEQLKIENEIEVLEEIPELAFLSKLDNASSIDAEIEERINKL